MRADPHIERKSDQHHHRGTDSQYEEPPEHPHNAFKNSRWAVRATCAPRQAKTQVRSAFFRGLGHRFAASLDIFLNALQPAAGQLRSGGNFFDVGEGFRIVEFLAKFLQEGMDFSKSKKHFATASGFEEKIFV